jgi:hypothetical protein
MRKKTFYILLIMFFFTNKVVFSQAIIENPEKPLSKDAGRVVELQKVMQIDEEADKFFFKYPRILRAAPDGTLFALDQDQLIRFDRDGRFLRNFFKKGQGPGELQAVSNYFVQDNHIIIHDQRLSKIVHFDLEGNLVREFKLHDFPSFSRLHLVHNNTYYLISHSIPSTEGKWSAVDAPNDLCSVKGDGKDIKQMATFPVLCYVISSGGTGAMINVAELITVSYKKKNLFISHTEDYLVKLYDTELNQVVKSFKRKYKRVKVPEGKTMGGRVIIGDKTYTSPQKYVNDITRFLIFDDLLWVATSTVDKQKGVLIDVFDVEGRYLDNFYLKFPYELDPISILYKPMELAREYLYAVEKNEDDTISIRKYRVGRN